MLQVIPIPSPSVSANWASSPPSRRRNPLYPSCRPARLGASAAANRGEVKNRKQGGMAVTHDDLAVRERGAEAVGGERGLFLIVFSVLCGLASLILCLAAEATRSEATWLLLTSPRDGRTYRCFYSSSGKTPLAFAVAAFLTLAVGMFTEHAYVLITAAGPRPRPGLAVWSAPPPSSRDLTWGACFFFVTTWICFAVAEVILMVGISAESGHLAEWRKPRSNCLVVRQGLYAAAGVFGLTTVFLAAGLYLTALQAQRLHDDEDSPRRRIPESSAPRLPTYGSAPAGPPQNLQLGQASHQAPGEENPGTKASSSATSTQ